MSHREGGAGGGIVRFVAAFIDGVDRVGFHDEAIIAVGDGRQRDGREMVQR